MSAITGLPDITTISNEVASASTEHVDPSVREAIRVVRLEHWPGRNSKPFRQAEGPGNLRVRGAIERLVHPQGRCGHPDNGVETGPSIKAIWEHPARIGVSELRGSAVRVPHRDRNIHH